MIFVICQEVAELAHIMKPQALTPNFDRCVVSETKIDGEWRCPEGQIPSQGSEMIWDSVHIHTSTIGQSFETSINYIRRRNSSPYKGGCGN